MIISLILPTAHSESESLNTDASESNSGLFDFQLKRTLERAQTRQSISILAAGTLSVLLTNPHDDEIRREWRDQQKMSESSEQIGDFLGSGIPGVLTAATQSYWSDPAANSHWRTLVTAGTTSSLLKITFGRGRPGANSNHLSFPSGHTTMAFATAASLSLSYGWKWGLFLYPMAAFVGLSRVSADVHWASDVAGGATVGIWSAYIGTFPDVSLAESPKVRVVPVANRDFLGMLALYQF